MICAIYFNLLANVHESTVDGIFKAIFFSLFRLNYLLFVNVHFWCVAVVA